MAEFKNEQRWQCRSCEGISLTSELLTAPNPFDPEDTVQGCPKCKSAEGFEQMCDEPGCNRPWGGSGPWADGLWRATCTSHSRFRNG